MKDPLQVARESLFGLMTLKATPVLAALLLLVPLGSALLRLRALPAPDLLHARNTLTQMLADPELEAITLLDTKAMTDHQKAGLCMLCSTPSWIGVVQEGGHRHIILHTGSRELMGPELLQDTIQLKVHITRSNRVLQL